jgi:multicomponent Na+:H+ antiporter subunit C
MGKRSGEDDECDDDDDDDDDEDGHPDGRRTSPPSLHLTMEPLLALLVAVLFGLGVYLLIQRNLLRAVFGLILISNAANLLIFTMGRLTRAVPPVIPAGLDAPEVAVANPLPQALVLTAIVIGFGLIVFTLVLVMRAYESLRTVVPDEVEHAEVGEEKYAKGYVPSTPEAEDVPT